MQSACRKTQIWTTFFLSVLIAFTLLHAQSEYVLNEVASYNTEQYGNLTCFDWYNGTVYYSVQSATLQPYIYALQFPSMQVSPRSVQSTNVNCVNSMSDGRVMYTTPPAVYQTIPSIDTPFDFYNIKEIKDYQGRYIMLTGYGGIRGTDQYGNMTKGLPFAYSSLTFTGISTDGDRIYASLGNSTILVFNASFSEVDRIDLGDVAINGVSVYRKGNETIIASPTSAGVYLLMLGKHIKSSETVFNRCIIGNATLVVCSDNSTLRFMEIVNVSEKVREYLNLSATLEAYIANATKDEYTLWAQQQLNLSKSLEDKDIVASIAIAKNISIAELQKRAKKVVVIQNVTKNETQTANTTPSQPSAAQPSLFMVGAIAVVLVVAFLAIIGVVAYYMLSRHHGGSGPEGKGGDAGQGPKYRFGS